MKLYKNRKGVNTLVANLRQDVSYKTRFSFNPSDNRINSYSVELSPQELLSTAKAALGRLQAIAGVEYQVFAKIKQDDTWRAI